MVFTPKENAGLCELFGQGPDGAQRLLDRLKGGFVKLPAGVTRETLRRYAKIAQRAIDAGKDRIGTQARRLDAIEHLMRSTDESR